MKNFFEFFFGQMSASPITRAVQKGWNSRRPVSGEFSTENQERGAAIKATKKKKLYYIQFDVVHVYNIIYNNNTMTLGR